MEKKKHLITLINLFLERICEFYADRLDIVVDGFFIKRIVAVRVLNIKFVSVVFLWSILHFFTKIDGCLTFSHFYSRKVSLYIQKVWRCFISYCGDRCLLGTRRIALRGLFVKQRYVTRYNYKSYTQYLWRRNQRRWRLFVMRRRPRFFFRRYKKFRRFRYALSYNLSAKVQQPFVSFRFRRVGSYTRLFVQGFLFWRFLILNKSRWKRKNSTVNYWKRSVRFSFMRTAHKFRPYQAQGTLLCHSKRRCRFLRSKKTNRLGVYNQLTRLPLEKNFSTHQSTLRVTWGFQQCRQLRLKSFFRTRSTSLSRLLSVIKFRQLRSYCRVEKNAVTQFKRHRVRRRRWPRQMWRFYKRRRKILRIRIATFLLRRRRLQRRRWLFLKKNRFFRRIKRRLKRRKKRRIRYFGRWAKRYLKRRRRRFRGFARKRRKNLLKKSTNIAKTRALASDIFSVVRSKPLRFLHQRMPSILPLSNVVKFQTAWSKSTVLDSKLVRFNRVLNRRYLHWVEDSIPQTANLSGFTRYRRFVTFGRYKGWLKILFVKGKRLYYYRELKQPFALAFVKRNMGSTLKYRIKTFHGATVSAMLVPQLAKKRYLKRLREAFYRRRRSRLSSSVKKFRFKSLFRRRYSKFRIKWYRTRSRRRFWGKQRQRGFRFMARNRFSFYKYWFSRRRGILLLLRRQVLLRNIIFRHRYRTLSFFRRFSSWRFAIKRLRDIRKIRSRRVIERFLGYRSKRLFLFRIRFLQNQPKFHLLRINQNLLFRKCFRQLLVNFTRKRKTRRFTFLLRMYFLTRFKITLRQRLVRVKQSSSSLTGVDKDFSFLQSFKNRQSSTKNRVISALLPVADTAIPRQFGKIPVSLFRVSRYFMRHGSKSLNPHFLLTRRYPSVYDFETFNYLFESTFFYKKFIQMGKRWRSQILILSVLRYFRPYSSYHLIRFIKKFLIEGFPIFFEMSSLKQSNKEQPFPVPINLMFFQNYMLKALVTRFRAKRHAVCFQAALLLELWSWHVDPTVSILHDFLMNHYALGLDSRFFVHYRWRVNR